MIELGERDKEILDSCPQRGVWFRAGTHRSVGSDLPYRLAKLHRMGLLEQKRKQRGWFAYNLYNRVYRAEWITETCPVCKGTGGVWEKRDQVNYWVDHGCKNCEGSGVVRIWDNFVEAVRT